MKSYYIASTPFVKHSCIAFLRTSGSFIQLASLVFINRSNVPAIMIAIQMTK